MEKRNSHGHTPAGWYSALTVFVGFIVGGFGVGAYSLVLTVIGAAIVLLGVVVALVLQRAGYGQFVPGPNRSVTSARDYLGEQRPDADEPTAVDPARAAPPETGMAGSGLAGSSMTGARQTP